MKAGRISGAAGAGSGLPALPQDVGETDAERKFLASFEDSHESSDLVMPDGPNPNANGNAIDKDGTKIEDILDVFEKSAMPSKPTGDEGMEDSKLFREVRAQLCCPAALVCKLFSRCSRMPASLLANLRRRAT